MPIRINLLAEAQTAAEMRRKDPVKRGIWVASFMVCAVGLWIAKLQTDVMFENSSYGKVESDWKKLLPNYSYVTNEQTNILIVNRKLDKLDYLRTNRFLWAPVLNALQKTMVDQVQVTHLKGEESFTSVFARDVRVGTNKVHYPAGMEEKFSLAIDAKDLKPNDQNYTKYKETLCNFDFFTNRLGRRDGFVMEGVLSPLTVDPVDPSKSFVTFTLASHFQPKVIHE